MNFLERKLTGTVGRRSPFLHGKWKGYKKLLVSTGTTPGVDKIPTQEEYENALEGDDDLDKKIVKLGELNEPAYEALILSINTSSSVRKSCFWASEKCKKQRFPGAKLQGGMGQAGK